MLESDRDSALAQTLAHLDLKAHTRTHPPLPEPLIAGCAPMPKIKVHERALAHLSRGLYRSPASALRELVSNAWDANATRVTIDTNHPKFFQLSIEDDGDGFTGEEFAELMGGGIGNSTKRIDPKPLKYGRPTI